MARPTSIGEFQVIGTLGSGAHSQILHVRRSEDSRQYALKVVPLEDKDDQKFLEQARHEYRVAQMLDHPHLIKLYCLETPRDWLFRVRKAHLLIEYVNGKTIDQVKGLTLPRLLRLFEQVVLGLVHMHRRGVWHADLKPNNIMLSKTGEVKIIDYGLAWIKGEPKDRVQGTPEYMAPEQGRQSTVNDKTDIYNLGATMYRMVTWRLPPSSLATVNGTPIDSKTFHNMLKPVAEHKPETPKALCALIHRCLSFQPQQRPGRIGEVLDVLKELIDEHIQTPEDELDALEW